MNRLPSLLALALVLAGSASMTHAQVIINELMQSNIDCVMDDQNEYPDSWVELHNPTDSLLSLDGYRLGLNNDPAQAYALPLHTMIAPHGYRLVYCDKTATGWHTDFRLESGNGGAVFLFNGTYTHDVVDSVTAIPKQPAPNIAYGRISDGEQSWGYQLLPSPGQSNSSGVSQSGILDEPVFSMPGQVFTAPGNHTLTLSLPHNAPQGCQIRYTLNGSEPTMENSILYSQPLTINTTTTVRAKLFCTGYISPRSTTHSYICLNREMHLPVVSIVTDEAHFYDNKKGIYVRGTYSTSKENYKYDWRRPINLEFFPEPNTRSALNQLCETRIQGGASRDCALKSLALYANKRFGEKRFNYEFFPDQKPGLRSFKSLLLRNAGNDFDYLYMRDALIQRSMARYQDIDWQAWRPAIVFINGVYKGIENIRERSNEDNIYTNYNGLEDIVMMENTWDLKAGTWDDWNAFKQFYEQAGHSWEEYEQQMDCIEIINVMILDLFYNNQDWPGNNTVFWRPQQATDQRPARWRIIVKDTDFGLGLYDSPANYQTISWLYNNAFDGNRNWANQPDHTRMYRRALDNETFRHHFVSRAAIYIGDFLNLDAVWPLWEQMYDMIRDEYPVHRKLYNEWWPNYASELNKAKQWLQQRPDFFLNQLVTRYGLGQLKQLDINTTLSEDELDDMHLQMEGVELSRPVWSGGYYANSSITLVARTSDDSRPVVCWQVVRASDDGEQTTTIQGDSCCLVLRPGDNRVEVTALRTEPTAVEVLPAAPQVEKRIDNGQVVIIKNGLRYNLLGTVMPMN